MLEQFNILDWVVLVICAFFVIRAVSKGFLREMGSLVGLVLAIWGSMSFYQPVADFLRRVVGKQDFWWETLAFILCFLVIYLLTVAIAGRISKVLYSTSLSFINRILGAVVGLAKGVIVCFVLINLLLMMQPLTNALSQYHDVVSKSYLTPFIMKGGRIIFSFVPQDLADKARTGAGNLQERASDLVDSAGE